jgi:hypothetical protein
MNDKKYKKCIENVSQQLKISHDDVKKVVDEKYKSDVIFRLQTQMKIIFTSISNKK